MDRKVSREVRKSQRVYKTRPLKRKQYFNPKSAETDDGGASTSAKKLRDQDEYHVPKTDAVNFRIINFFTVFSTLASLVKCAKCNSKICFGIVSERGLGFKISVVCDKCTPQYIPSCDFIHHSYEINRRFTLAMRVIGVGYKGAHKFCALMDFPPWLAKSTYCVLLEHICEASKNMAQFFMKKASKEEINLNSTNSEEKNTDLIVSGDGTWHKRGFSSLFGVTSLIGHFTGKVLDVIVKSSYCQACEVWKNRKDTEEYQEWYEAHKETCSTNHTGSAGTFDAIEPIYESLPNTELLQRCIGGFTQNSNESFNQIVWKVMPKTLPASYTTVSIAAYIATCTFNEGTYGLLAVFDAMGIKLGPYAHEFAKAEDSIRIKQANRRFLENTREARVARRQLKVASNTTNKAQEGEVYGPGIDDSI